MTIPILGGAPFPYRTYSNIAPFSASDGATFLDVLEELRDYIRDDLTPFINTEMSAVVDAFAVEVDGMILQVTTALAANTVEIDGKIAANTVAIDGKIAANTVAIDGKIAANTASMAASISAMQAQFDVIVQQIITSSIVMSDPVITGIDSNALSAFRVQQDARLKGLFQQRVARNPRDYGASLTYGFDNTAAFAAAITAAGVGGVVEFYGEYTMAGTLDITNLASFQGFGPRASSIIGTTDVPTLIANGGQAQNVRDLRLRSTIAGTRTSFNILWGNPTKPLIQNVEIDLPTTTQGAGGIKFKNNGVIVGQSAFMPQLRAVWIRNGLLVSDQVTDGHVSDCWIWGSFHNARASVDLYYSNGWTFVGSDIGATINGGCAYRLEGTKQTTIVGGYFDGGPTTVNSGFGLIGVNSSGLHVSGTHFYHHGRSGILLTGCNGMTFSSIGFYRNNKQDGGWPDIDLVNSKAITFTNTAHAQPIDRVSRGIIFREDVTCAHNSFDGAAVNLSEGNFYGTPLFSGNEGTLGKNNRAHSLWPRPTGVPFAIQPPSCAGITPAVVWPGAYRTQFHRFNLADSAAFRYANVRVEVGSGNIQVAVVKLDGLNYTRVMASAILPCTTGMSGAIDMTSVFLEAGDYALVVWVDNVTAQLRVATDENIRVPRFAAELTLTSAGIPATGTLTAWNSSRAVLGCSLSTN